MPKKTMMSWSTGKDSAWALYQLLRDPRHHVAGLFCTVNKAFSRTAMHAVRIELLQQQATSMGLPLDIIEIPYPCSNVEYEVIMQEFVIDIKSRGVECFAFGDLFLEDIRDYRIEKLKGADIEPVFPLWDQPTRRLSMDMIAGGLEAVITCVDPKQLDGDFVGRIYNEKLLDLLPASIDPCGENGEFHSFVFNAPMFANKIDITVGEKVERDGFVFADIMPVHA